MGGKKVFELILEFGHKSAPLKQKSANGYTHKWTAFVRGLNDSKIEHCIQKVIFLLHDSFDVPKRSVHEPPFQIKETGYAGFEVPIEIYFKNREKPNHLVFVHDLCLLKNKPHDATTVEKIKFINPNKEFEKLLIKSGAQELKIPVKKERSDSPPAKKQKSSSLIPSKDMNKQLQPPTNLQDSHLNSSNNPSLQSQPPKTSSKQFIDVFGAPLVYNSNNPSSRATTGTSVSTNSSAHSYSTSSNLPISNSIINYTQPAVTPVSNASTVYNSSTINTSSNTNSSGSSNTTVIKSEKRDEHSFDLQTMQSKISCISDSDRLQRIVDIVEGAGEWYNVTPKKFEFDLKRLDKKTLIKIDRCLQY